MNEELSARARLLLEPHSYRGRLIVVEGLDGAGKSTTVEIVANLLAADRVSPLLTRQPTTAVRESDLFKRYLYEPDSRSFIDYRALVALILSDRLQHLHETVRPALAAGRDVLCDRYIYTIVASMRARGYEEDWLVEACRLFPRPDVAVLIDAPFDAIERRVRSRKSPRESYMERALYQRSQEEFWLMAEQGELVRMDSTLSNPSEIGALVLRLLRPPASH